MDWKTTLIVIIPVFVVTYISGKMGKVFFTSSQNIRKNASTQNSRLQQLISGIEVLRVMGREKQETGKYINASTDYTKSVFKLEKLYAFLEPLYATISKLGIILVIVFGGRAVMQGSMSVGRFSAYFALFLAFADGTYSISAIINRYHSAKATWERICEKINIDKDKNSKTVKNENKQKEKNNTNDFLEVSNMSFTYPLSSVPVLENINFKANKGDFIGITGSVGSGKSALAAAMSGLYEYSGSIKINGQELRDISEENRQKLLAFQGHDSFLFSGTIMENITFENDESLVDKEKLNTAIAVAALNDDLSGFTDGIQTKVGAKGTTLSGGQRQRVSLARALYKNSDIVMLDDPFSAVDVRSEKRMSDGLKNFNSDKVMIVMTHRLDSLKNADIIIVLSSGKVCQQGSHEKLINESGIYADILQAQNVLGGDRV